MMLAGYRRSVSLSIVLGALLLGCRQEPVDEIRAPQGEAAQAADPVSLPPGSWPWWRGEDRDGIAHHEIADFQWSSQPNVVWSAKIQGLGHSTPIIVGDKVFLTTADAKQETKSLICFETVMGKPVWTTTVHQGGFMRTHQKNSQASATPASDGNYIFTAYVVKDSLYVTAVDMKGQIVWQKEAGPFQSQHGYGSSPIIYESFVIVLSDSNGPGFLAALRRDTGDIAWRVGRSTEPSYGTPILAEIDGKQQILVGGTGSTSAYDPQNGDLLWSVDGPAKTTANTPAVAGDLVISTGGYPQNGSIAVRVGASEEEGREEIVWEARERIYVPSPLVHDGKIYAVNDDGIGLCYDAQTGERLSRKRIGGNFSSSLTLYGKHMLVPDEDGTMHVFEATPDFNSVGEFRLEGSGFASPVFAGGKLYWRTSTHLFCLAPAS
ncbi:outer membrane protein assembly factor BamB family protein [Bremerella alba]|uniref:Outer membrane protein assembly factor BamB n=1 Tax=Bremerella alba TaxID=980252 RepID=A0A7V9A5J8_9BACT|nr:PQQ-binding-like beta-propeller repeat protein [Bremerella alba]MBA2113288.1 Outer membrane protein assembly factor BamB [Bremerella alba]